LLFLSVVGSRFLSKISSELITDEFIWEFCPCNCWH
jgi:hypothetical protein